MPSGHLYRNGGEREVRSGWRSFFFVASPNYIVNCGCSFTSVKGTQWYEQTKEELMAPTLLPELHLLKQVSGI